MEGTTAVVPIDGVLTARPDIFVRWLFGGNPTYEGIIAAADQAATDPKVKRMRLEFGEAPGGMLTGLEGAIEALQRVNKPIEATVKYQAASAAYALASQADKITVADKGVEVGSIGVAVDAWVPSDVVHIANRESPNKRPDLTTEEGVGALQDELDEAHTLIAGHIAKGRGVSLTKLNETFGRGALFLSERALAAGMIDKIVPPKTRRLGMNDEEMKQAIEEAKKVGATNERKRVLAHLRLAGSSGAADYAIQCIEEGTPVDDSVVAHHTSANLDRINSAARAADNPSPVSAAGGDIDALDEQVAALL